MYKSFGLLKSNLAVSSRSDSTHSGIAYLPYLDGLRAIAVFLVLLVHFPFVQGSSLSKGLWDFGQAIRAGYLGVDLFFVLSGFLITRILLQEKKRNGTINLKSFFMKRALRIIPIYYLCVLIATLYFGNSFESLSSLLTFTFNFYHPLHPAPNALEHTWSLSVEEQFYLIWPFLITRISNGSGILLTRYLIPALSLLIALIFAASLDSTLSASLIYMSGPTRMMSLSLGSCLAFQESIGDTPRDKYSFLGLGAGCVLLLADNFGRHFGVIPAGGFYWSIALVGYAMLCASAISLLIFGRGGYLAPIRSLLSLPFVRYVGRISYGLYLYHYLILFLMDLPPYKVEGIGTTFGRAFTAAIATIAVASLSYRFIERPLLSLKKRLAAQNSIKKARPAELEFGVPAPTE